MAMSPSSLLAKLDELKRWQQVQQERLLKQHQTRLEAADSLYSDLNISKEDYSGKNNAEHLSSEVKTSQITGNNWHEEEEVVSPRNITKKPFLKRGTGLGKYGMKYGDQKKPFNKMKAPKVYKTVFHKRIDQIKTDETEVLQKSQNKDKNEKIVEEKRISPLFTKEKHQPESKHTEKPLQEFTIKNIRKSKSPSNLTPLRAPEVSVAMKPKAKWCPVEPDDYEPSCLPSILPSGSLPGISHISDYHPTENLMNNGPGPEEEVEQQQQQENNPMQLFQNNPALFQALQKLASEHFGTPGAHGQSTLDQTDFLSKLTMLDQESTIYQTPNNNNNTQLVKYLQDLLKRCENNTPGDLTSYEHALEKELRVFEQLEEKAMNSSFCSTNSSIMELLASTPHRVIKNKAPTFATIQEGCNSGKFVPQNVSQPEKAPQMVSTGAQSSFNNDCSVESRASAKKMLVYPEMYRDNETTTRGDFSEDSSINSEDFECTNANIVPQVIVKQNASTMTDPVDAVNEELLKDKLKELEAEISTFRTENRKIEKAKSDLERERLEFQRTKKSLEKEYLQKREELECEVEDERKKLNKEKQVFEKYTKEMQNKPNRKEREEISDLKAELVNVKETLKVKETRNGTTQARLRTQIKSLEKDNGHLKEEVEKLQKANARLQNQTQYGRRGRQDDTKMLHEINKNLTKLTQDQKVVKALTKLEHSIDDKNSSEDSFSAASRVKQNKKSNAPKPETETRRQIKSSKAKKVVQKPSSGTESEELEEIATKNKRRSKVIVISAESSDNYDDVQIPERGTSSKAKRRSNDYETEYRRSYSRSSYKSDSDDDVLRTKSRNKSRSSLESRRSLDNKENEYSNGDITTFRNLSDLSVSENYEKVFGARGKAMRTVKDAKGDKTGQNEGRQLKRHNSLNDTQQTNSKVECILADGSKETKYPNGNVKTVSADGNLARMEYFNGDVKETALLEGTIKYFYKDTQIWQTTFSTGDETYEFPDGQIEKHFSDGSSHIQFPNGVVKHTTVDGSEQINYPDGSVVNVKENGDKVLLMPNGQKEIHTDQQKRREYPDGTVKIIYNDGLQETRYSNGRIRMKDKEGNLIMDSHND